MGVGFIYQSTNPTSPALLFGGKWNRIKDKFLLSAGDLFEAGTEGGEIEHTLTVSEMPSHKHSMSMYYVQGKAGSSNYPWLYSAASDGMTGSTSTGINMSNTGNSQAHNNMPPYQVVYVWEKIQEGDIYENLQSRQNRNH